MASELEHNQEQFTVPIWATLDGSFQALIEKTIIEIDSGKYLLDSDCIIFPPIAEEVDTRGYGIALVFNRINKLLFNGNNPDNITIWFLSTDETKRGVIVFGYFPAITLDSYLERRNLIITESNFFLEIAGLPQVNIPPAQNRDL